MRGVNRRRAASSDAAAASSPSDSDSEDDAAAKSGRLESDSEFSDRRSGDMGGIPAGGAGPPPPAGAKGTSSSAVKSIVAACSVLASCCSIAASRVRAARRWSPHQSVWLRCVSRAVGHLRRARRPSTSVASSPTARLPARCAAQGVRLPIVVGRRTAQAPGAPRASHGSQQRSARRKTELYAAVLSFTLPGCPPLPAEQAAAE